MNVGDYAVYAIAVVAMVFLAASILYHLKSILTGALYAVAVAAVAGVGLLALGVVGYMGAAAWLHVSEQQTMEQCLTAHERRAKADAAPNDYFGKQLREAAAEEAKKCSALAAKKEAENRPGGN